MVLSSVLASLKMGFPLSCAPLPVPRSGRQNIPCRAGPLYTPQTKAVRRPSGWYCGLPLNLPPESVWRADGCPRPYVRRVFPPSYIDKSAHTEDSCSDCQWAPSVPFSRTSFWGLKTVKDPLFPESLLLFLSRQMPVFLLSRLSEDHFGSLKELFNETIRLNTGFSFVLSLQSTQK